jgi:hypothetical protein
LAHPDQRPRRQPREIRRRVRREHKYGGDWIKTTNTGGYFSPGDVRSLEHAYLIDDEALDMAENAGVFLVPTTQATREDRAGLAEGTLADYTAADSLVWPTGRGLVRCSVTTTDLRRRPRKILHRPRLGKCLASLLSGYPHPSGRAPDPASIMP